MIHFRTIHLTGLCFIVAGPVVNHGEPRQLLQSDVTPPSSTEPVIASAPPPLVHLPNLLKQCQAPTNNTINLVEILGAHDGAESWLLRLGQMPAPNNQSQPQTFVTSASDVMRNGASPYYSQSSSSESQESEPRLTPDTTHKCAEEALDLTKRMDQNNNNVCSKCFVPSNQSEEFIELQRQLVKAQILRYTSEARKVQAEKQLIESHITKCKIVTDLLLLEKERRALEIVQMKPH